MNKKKTRSTNKNHDDEIKNIAGRIPEATRSTTTSQKAEAITFCIKPLTHYLPGSDLQIVKFKPLSPRERQCSKISLLKTFGNVKKV